ncbi:MAG: hypothetical protein HC925_03565 [Coleofasciculaceae cyanobacterium SM2_3_26]|nr:hypothetical protein [Coleofasciculaceae cyanobacterium SM2_3_26]
MSTRKHYNQLEHQRLLRLAREYRQKGYSVTVHPAAEDLPPALAEYSFDMIACGEGKAIAVAVRTRDHLTLNGKEDLRRMSNMVNKIQGWEFELVVTNPRKKAVPEIRTSLKLPVPLARLPQHFRSICSPAAPLGDFSLTFAQNRLS